jgi:Rps23 Pro-64 3,4-dihydroxylase Tpa1-like proline 4-hydroxylase
MLNKNLNPDILKKIYSSEKRILIPNFLDEEFAEYVYQGIIELTARELWYQTNFGNPKIKRTNILEKPGKVYKSFSYSYEKYPVINMTLYDLLDIDSRRINVSNVMPIKENPEKELPQFHPLIKISQILNSDKMHQLISFITSHKLTYRALGAFVSRYKAGSYNGLHDDGHGIRRVAFVLNFTKYWVAHWGGNMVIMDNKYENIKQTYTPQFNSLILFDVPLPHAVLPVSVYCPGERLAITGWYNFLGKNYL